MESLNTTASPKITIPILEFNRTGGLRILTQIVNHLSGNGWQVEFLVPEDSADPCFPLVEGVVVKTYKVRRHGWLRMLSAWVGLIRWSCQDTDVCLANYYTTAYPIWLSWLLRNRKVKIVYLAQSYEPLLCAKLQEKYSPLVRDIKSRLIALTYRLPFRRIAVSSWVRNHIKGSMMVIPNGIDADFFFPAEEQQTKNKFVVGAIGRTQKVKGFDVFLKAVQSLLSHPEFEIHVLSDELQIPPPGTKLIQPQSDEDIRSFYQACDVFVFPSFLEGFGLPPLEAMACGTPVILSDSGGVREYAHAENALIVPVNDSGAILEAVMNLYRHPEIRQELREAGLETAQQYTTTAMLEHYRTYFDSLVTILHNGQ